jgi:hypothetical protein
MTRLPDWEKRLHAALIERMSQPFAWGTHDCALFACDCILAMTGVDAAAWFRGKYRNHNGARRVMRKFTGGYGLESLADQIARQHRVHEVPITKAQRGDLLLLDSRMGPTLAIVSLDGFRACAASPQGLESFPVLQARRAWRI